MTPNLPGAIKLRSHLDEWLCSHDLAHDGVFDVPDNPEDIDTSRGAEPTYLVLRFDGDLYDLFYKRQNDDLRAEFDQIVANDGFWYEFYDSTTLHFMHDAQLTPGSR